MPSVLDLIDTPTALAGLPSSLPTADAALVPFWISAASRLVARHCRRVFQLRDYVELRTPDQPTPYRAESPEVLLSQFPVRSLASCRGARIPALTVSNTDAATNQRATAEVLTLGDAEWLGMPSPVGLRLARVASGVASSSTFLWAGPSSWDFAASATTTGSIAAGTYSLCYTAVSADGAESPASPTLAITTTATGGIAVTLPPLPDWAASWKVYGGASTTYYQATATGESATLSTLATTGATPPTSPYPTVASLASAVAALGNGWAATVPAGNPSPGLFPSSDLYREPGPAGCLSRGAALSVFARDLHPRLDPANGKLYLPDGWDGYGEWGACAGGYPGWPGPAPADGQGGSWLPPVRVAYRAGWATVPEPVQQACLVLVQTLYNDAKVSGVYESQTFGQVSYRYATLQAFPRSVRANLSRYVRAD